MRSLLIHRLYAPLAITISMIGSANTQAQVPTPQEPRTKLEAFEKQTGTVVVKGFSNAGSVSGLGTVSVICMEFTDVSTGIRQLGVVIEVTESGRLERSDRSFVDYDEIEPLLKGIDYISQVTPAATKLAKFEATYKTKGDLRVITFSGASGQIEAAVSSGYIGAVSCFISTAKLSELRAIIAQAKHRLDEIK
mgnify:CR=1 FL=1